jgi:DNA-binding CsgD family transcriptional regulator
MNTAIDIGISNTALSELISDIYDASLSANWAPVLDNIIDMTGANNAFFLLQKLDSPAPLLLEFQTKMHYPEQALLDYQSRPFEDPFYMVTKDMTEGETLNLNDYVDISKHIGSDYFENIFRKVKCYYAIGGILCRDGVHESIYAVQRWMDDEAFGERELNLLSLLTPHMIRAMHIYKELTLYKSYANISKSILDQTDKAIIVCNADGKVISANVYANQHLLGNSQISFGGDEIRLSNPANHKRLHSYISQCSRLAFNGVASQESIVVESGNHTHALITVSPLKPNSGINDIDVPCCLVTIKFQSAMNWALVEREMGLTERELSLLKAIYTKQKLNDLTASFGVSYNTLRTHLQNIFKKFGINSQTELMIKLSVFKS